MPFRYRCKDMIDNIDVVKINGKNFHTTCSQIYQDSQELNEYICNLFDYIKPGPRILTQIKQFTQENGYTHKGIQRTLQYFYEVQNNTIQKSNGGIGIVPYMYNEAQAYYQRINKAAEKMSENIHSPKTRTVDIASVQQRNQIKKKQEIDLSSLE